MYLVINSKNQTVSNYASLKKTKVKGENSLGETPCMHLGTSVRIPNVMLLVARTVATDNIQYKYYTERSVGRRAMHSKNALGKEKKTNHPTYIYIQRYIVQELYTKYIILTSYTYLRLCVCVSL